MSEKASVTRGQMLNIRQKQQKGGKKWRKKRYQYGKSIHLRLRKRRHILISARANCAG